MGEKDPSPLEGSWQKGDYMLHEMFKAHFKKIVARFVSDVLSKSYLQLVLYQP